MQQREDLLRVALTDALGIDVGALRFEPVSGGCINTTNILHAAGQRFFVKWNEHPLPRQFESEARGLEAMVATGTSLVIPRPVTFCDGGPGRSFLVVEHLAPGTRIADFDERLGRGLAELHTHVDETARALGFGFFLDGYCGATPQPNGWLPDWVTFYGERRMRHQLRLARKDGLTASEAGVIERVIARLPDLIADDEPPALIHGDLWSGNLHVAPDGRPALIDPAAYFGHREAELGMMVLFGGFGPRVFAAYEELRPLREGWRERLDLYSLYHVLNHFHLFGGGYRTQAVALAQRYA